MPRLLLQHVLMVCLIAGLITPKLSGLLMHISPHVTTAVICTGGEMVTVQLDAQGRPVETEKLGYGPCLIADPNPVVFDTTADWFAAPRSYRHGFSIVATARPTDGHFDYLPDLRGPPVLI